MLKTLQKKIRAENLVFTNKRALFWERRRYLIISDLHIGKPAHFRKNGIAVPSEILRDDLRKLEKLIQHFAPEKIIIVGDLFHAGYNSDLDIFKNWRENFSQDFILIKGNHDRVSNQIYSDIAIQTFDENYMEFPFTFMHQPTDSAEDIFTISGHIHPGFMLETKTERMKFPCFAYNENQLVLPAFSKFTGLDLSLAKGGYRFIPFTRDYIFEV